MAKASARLVEQERRRIETALKRIEAEEYGYCILCDEDIAVKRLEFDPSPPHLYILCAECRKHVIMQLNSTAMDKIQYKNNRYETPEDSASSFGKFLPSFSFYSSFLSQIYGSAKKAKKGEYDSEAWRLSSFRVMQALERTGLKITISGIEHLQSLNSSCVFVGNHVSMMDTVVLPAILAQEMPTTFIIKQSLMDYPVFKHVIAV